jgi:hypothetical protein
MKILKTTIKLSYERFIPNPYQRRYHFAIAFDGNKPFCLSQNNPIKVNAKAFRMGQKFNIPTYKEFPYSHAESHLVSQLLDRYNTIDPNWSVVVVRIGRDGRMRLSKPCENCAKILKAVELNNIYWSVGDNHFEDSDNTQITIDSDYFFRYAKGRFYSKNKTQVMGLVS